VNDYGVAPPPTARIKLAALRAAFPDFSIDITGGRGSLRTVSSTSARELRRILLGRCTAIKDL